jgi:membrane fusion protein, multidrug efflux system
MEQEEKKKFNLRSKRTVWLILVIMVLGIGIYFGYQWLIFRWRYVSTDDAQVKGNLINLSAKVSGRVIKLQVEEGDRVQAGQVLVELEKKDYAAARAQAQANLEMARQSLAQATTQLLLTRERVIKGIETAEASLGEAKEGLTFAEEDAILQADRVQKEIDRAEAALESMRAKVLEARATMVNAQKEFQRNRELFQQGYIAENARDAAETAWQVAQSRYQLSLENEREALSQLALAKANQRSVDLKKQSIRIAGETLRKARVNLALAQEEKKQITLQEKGIAVLQAKVQEAEAAWQLADIHWQETTISSPIRGVVAKRFADEGQMVQPGQTILNVNNPEEKWVVANVEETKVRRVKKGARVIVEVDAFPDRTFEGRVEFIGSAALSEFALLPADNPSGNFVKITHRLPVRVSVSDPQNHLRPGMMVVVAIEAREKEGGGARAQEGEQKNH